MNTHSALCLLALPLVLGLGATSSAPPSELLDLTPRFEKDQELVITMTYTMDGALDQLAVMVDGTEVMGDGVSFDMEGEGEVIYSETILEVRDGQIAKMRITVDEESGSMTGDVDAMGNTESLDETFDSEMVGRTVEIVVDEDGESEVTDVTENPSSEAPEMELNAMTHENHFEEFLPKDPVEEGVEFELGTDWLDLAREMIEGDMSEFDDLGADQAEMVRVMLEAFFEGTSIEANGTVTGVEDGIATIDYELSAIMAIDDLVSIISQALPPELGGEIPSGVEAALEVNMEIEGTGKFNLELGQMIALNLSGDYEVIFSGSADVEGTSASAEASMSGTFTMASTIDVN